MSAIEDRIRKLLNLSKDSANEHEAATAAARASQMMAEHHITEAMLRLSDDSKQAELITEGKLDGTKVAGKRVAWKLAIASAVAESLGCEFWFHGGAGMALGRESSIQAWNYTSQYLMREIDRLATERWEVEKREATAHGHSARAWCNAFRVGAARAVATRLRYESEVNKAARRQRVAAAVPAAVAGDSTADASIQALAIVDRDEQEVKSRYAEISKGFTKASAIGKVSVRSGYHAGKEAGASIRLGGGRAGLPEGQRSIRGGK